MSPQPCRLVWAAAWQQHLLAVFSSSPWCICNIGHTGVHMRSPRAFTPCSAAQFKIIRVNNIKLKAERYYSECICVSQLLFLNLTRKTMHLNDKQCPKPSKIESINDAYSNWSCFKPNKVATNISVLGGLASKTIGWCDEVWWSALVDSDLHINSLKARWSIRLQCLQLCLHWKRQCHYRCWH